jgi:hypothetical protein
VPPGIVIVGCPGCGRAIPLPPNELTWQIECSRCGTRFVPTGSSAPPTPQTWAPAEDEIEITDTPAPPRRPGVAPLALGAIVLIVLVLCGVGGVVLLGKDKGSKPGIRQFNPPVETGFEEFSRKAKDFGAAGLLCTLVIVYLVTLILLLAWVARDARARGVDGGAVWVLIVLCTYFLGLIVYMAARPHGKLVACQRCGNKRLMAALACPHCGQPSAPVGV